jgi:hypothetical protein
MLYPQIAERKLKNFSGAIASERAMHSIRVKRSGIPIRRILAYRTVPEVHQSGWRGRLLLQERTHNAEHHACH